MTKVLNTTPGVSTDANQGEGGIWQTGAGLASDGSQLFFLVANGDYNPNVGNYGDSFLKVTPDTSTPAAPHLTGYGLNVTGSFTPFNEQSLADADADLGSGGVVVLPDQPGPYPHEVIGAGKAGVIYVVNRDNLGGHTTTVDNVIQTVGQGHGNFNSPAYFNSAIYYHAVGDVLKRYTLTNGLLSAAPASQGTITYSGQGATPSLSSNGTANGIVWDVQFDGTHQVLHAYDATSLAELYNSNQNIARDQMGVGVKFIVPTVADGHVFVGSSGSLSVYGLVTPPTTAPAAPSNLTATAIGTSTVNLAWVDNSNNEAGFKIERSGGQRQLHSNRRRQRQRHELQRHDRHRQHDLLLPHPGNQCDRRFGVYQSVGHRGDPGGHRRGQRVSLRCRYRRKRDRLRKRQQWHIDRRAACDLGQPREDRRIVPWVHRRRHLQPGRLAVGSQPNNRPVPDPGFDEHLGRLGENDTTRQRDALASSRGHRRRASRRRQ